MVSGGAFHREVISWPLEGLVIKVSSVGGQSCLRDRAPVKTVDTKAQGSTPSWQYAMCVVTQRCQES